MTSQCQLITAVIRPSRLNEVKDALQRYGVTGMTVTESSGFGRQGGRPDTYRGVDYTTELIHKLRIEVLVKSADAENVIDVIVSAAFTGSFGDGKVWSTPVESIARVRTGERGTEAI
jgi:nitrogen regulatory protein P-II 1